VIRLHRRHHPPVDARVAQLAEDEGTNNPIHVGNAPQPDVSPLHHRSDSELRKDQPALGVGRKPDLGGRKGRRPAAPGRSARTPPPGREDRLGAHDERHTAGVEVDSHHRAGIRLRGKPADQPATLQVPPRRRQALSPFWDESAAAAARPAHLETSKEPQGQSPGPPGAQCSSEQQDSQREGLRAPFHRLPAPRRELLPTDDPAMCDSRASASSTRS
jgi:hypothetical protein